MTDQPNESRRPHPPPIDTPYLEFDIARELQQLHLEPGWQSGQNARTLVKYDGLRIVLIALQAGASIPEHHTEGQVSIQAIAGHIRVRAEGRSFELRPGGLLALEQGLPHDVEALEESAFLLTIAWPGGKDRSGRSPTFRSHQRPFMARTPIALISGVVAASCAGG
jgi:quercetin dioxygenase-like cupin family protein